jgi:hypothetical protein
MRPGTALRKNDPFRNFAKDGEIRALLCEKLFALAGKGVTDSDELRRLAMESLALKRLGS